MVTRGEGATPGARTQAEARRMSLDLSRGDTGVILAAKRRGGQENIRGLGREMKEILFLEWEDYKNNRPE